MPPRDWRLRVRDIVEAIERVEAFTRGVTKESFLKDPKTIAAASYELVIIGEAARHVAPEVRAAAPGIPWQDMRDMRNIVAHGYFGVDLEIVWETLTHDVPRLRAPLLALLGD